MQVRTRRERKFDEVEADLPDPSSHSKYRAKGKLADVLSYLGKRNPFPGRVGANDTLWLLDNTAYQNPKTGAWEAEFVSAIFAQQATCSVADAVTSLARKLDLADDDPAYPTLRERIMPFLLDVQPGKKVEATHADSTPLTLGPAGRNGITSDILQLPSTKPGSLGLNFARVPPGANGVLECKTFFAAPEGWAVISDIDDTIKVTKTSDPFSILRSTFLDSPTPCEGMPELYAYINSMLGAQAPWFYLSASPYNLYPFLREFTQRHYPRGTLILRDKSWRTIPGLLSNITVGTEEYKTDRIHRINSWLPKRKFICIGDSTQADPEAYGEIYRAHPDWVGLILIRKVTDTTAVGIEAKNDPDRFEEAFKDIPRHKWHVFENPEEAKQFISRAVAGDV